MKVTATHTRLTSEPVPMELDRRRLKEQIHELYRSEHEAMGERGTQSASSARGPSTQGVRPTILGKHRRNRFRR